MSAADLIKQTETLLDSITDEGDRNRMDRAQVVATLAVAEALMAVEAAVRSSRP